MRHDGAVSVTHLSNLLSAGGVVALTGAGISTDSGIPDYRGPMGAAQRRHAPMTYREFTSDPAARHRYWARSHAGWPMMRRARPNDGHRALAALESAGLVTGVITQNVDGLHQDAGSRRVIDLHGRLDAVACLACGERESRDHVEERLTQVNIGWSASPLVHNPDGDVDLTPDQVAEFVMVDCRMCHGPLKPDVVYFGESVPRDRVDLSYARVDDARALLVLGSSLHVYSGRRFVQRAAERGIPIAIVNQGQTRLDAAATVRIDDSISTVLMAVAST